MAQKWESIDSFLLKAVLDMLILWLIGYQETLSELQSRTYAITPLINSTYSQTQRILFNMIPL